MADIKDVGDLARELRSGSSEARSKAAAELARGRHAKLSKRARIKAARHAGLSTWAGYTKAQISEEMRRRRTLGAARRKERARKYEQELRTRIAAQELYKDE